MNIEEVIKIINSNNNLYRDLKYNLGKSLINYVAEDRDVDLDNFVKNFQNLTIEMTHSIVNKIDTYSYNPVTNVMVLNENYLAKKNINSENVYMQMTLDLLFGNGKITGFAGDGLKALNKGFRETIATKLVGEENTETFNSDEYIYTQLVGRIIGVENLMDAYKTNQPEIVHEALNKNNLNKINELAEYNISRNNDLIKNSELARIQVQLYRYCEMNHIPYEDIVNNMAFNSLIFENPSKYQSVDNLHKIIPIKQETMEAKVAQK